MKFQTRGFTSLLLTLSFLVATISGVVLYLTPRGRTANWTDWSILGLSKHEWSAIHINSCLLLLIVGAVHLFLNWAVFRSYLRKVGARGMQLKWETLLAVLLTVLVTGGAYFDLPPFRTVAAYRYRIKAYWDGQTAAEAESAPAAHAGGWRGGRGQGQGPPWSRD
jgi:hypothetical protein